MIVYIKQRRGTANATAEYNEKTKECIVLKGSILSDKIAFSEKFRGAKLIEDLRRGRIENGILKEDVAFQSASTAANFVTGTSTNGLIAWKDERCRCIKKIMEDDIYD